MSRDTLYKMFHRATAQSQRQQHPLLLISSDEENRQCAFVALCVRNSAYLSYNRMFHQATTESYYHPWSDPSSPCIYISPSSSYILPLFFYAVASRRSSICVPSPNLISLFLIVTAADLPPSFSFSFSCSSLASALAALFCVAPLHSAMSSSSRVRVFAAEDDYTDRHLYVRPPTSVGWYAEMRKKYFIGYVRC